MVYPLALKGFKGVVPQDFKGVVPPRFFRYFLCFGVSSLLCESGTRAKEFFYCFCMQAINKTCVLYIEVKKYGAPRIPGPTQFVIDQFLYTSKKTFA
jgi:hypothetical protein